MLPLRYPLRWQAAGIVILLAGLLLALAPIVIPWFGGVGPGIPELDKWLHGVVFLLLALWFTGQYARRRYIVILVALAGYGMLIEIGQSMIPYRTAEWGDLVADCIGILAGVLVALTLTGGWSLRAEAWFEKRFG